MPSCFAKSSISWGPYFRPASIMKYSDCVLGWTALNSRYKSSNRPLFIIRSTRPILLRCRLTCVFLSIGASQLATCTSFAEIGRPLGLTVKLRLAARTLAYSTKWRIKHKWGRFLPAARRQPSQCHGKLGTSAFCCAPPPVSRRARCKTLPGGVFGNDFAKLKQEFCALPAQPALQATGARHGNFANLRNQRPSWRAECLECSRSTPAP